MRIGFATSADHAELIDDDRLAATGPRVFNAPDVVGWNLDKRYLGELAAKGVVTPATRWIERGTVSDLGEILAGAGWTEAVVKPAISLTAYRTFRVSAGTARGRQRELDEILRDGDALVQEFLPEIITQGELSFVFLGGELAHVVEKRPAPGDFRVQSDFGGTWTRAAASEGDAAIARATFAGIETLYARVDMVRRGADLLLMELELLDPVLFFALNPDAPSRFAEALVARLSNG